MEDIEEAIYYLSLDSDECGSSNRNFTGSVLTPGVPTFRSGPEDLFNENDGTLTG
jgi:hypothetical protein